jgi:site-specific DNA-methyltransferase (adenine-specific)
MCGDCLKILPTIPDKSIDLIVTSPPYNLNIEYDNYKDNLEWKDYYGWCKLWLKECLRILKDDGRMALNHYLSVGNSKERNAPLMELNHIAIDMGFKHHGIAIWTDITIAKKTAWGSYLSASSPYINSPFEGILLLYKERWKKDNKGTSDILREDFIRLTRGIWNIKTETKGKTPCNFSIDFAKKCIQLLSYKGDIILDPFSGSGTTAVASLITGRKFIGIEQSEKYCKISRERLLINSPSKTLRKFIIGEN